MSERSLFAGFGGQGIISLGQIWVFTAMSAGKNVTFFPFYGAEKRGGIARASVVVSDEAIASPIVTTADSVIVMNEDSLEVCEKALAAGGRMLINSDLVNTGPTRKDINISTLAMNTIATELGNSRVANMVALGALATLSKAFPLDGVEEILKNFFPKSKHQFIPINVAAIEAGGKAF